MKSENGAIEIVFSIIVGIIILGIIGVAIYFGTVEYQNKETIEITVKDKYIKRMAQKRYQEYYNKTTEDFMARYGKNYL